VGAASNRRLSGRSRILAFLKPRIVVALGFGAVVAMAISGYTAANTVPISKGGDGAGTISGYTISSIAFTANATNAENIDAVTFNTNTAPPAGATVKVKIDASSSTWYACTFSGVAVTCSTTSPLITAALIDQVQVVIAQA